MVTATEERQKLHQYPVQALYEMWRDFEPSDPENHRKCGYIPTGTHCHVCGKQIGKPLAAQYSYQTHVLEDDHLTCVIAGGEQVGKSWIGAMKCYAVIMGFLGEYGDRAANEVAWLIGDSYEQTSREFEYLKMWLQQTHGLSIVKADNKVDPGEIHLKVPNGVFKIKTKSADDGMASIRMESPVVVLFCEAAIATYDAYRRLRSRVGRARADFPGYGAIILISTFEGSLGWYPDLWSKGQIYSTQEKENIKSFSLPSFSNVFIYKKGERDPEIRAMKAELSEDEFKERILAIPSPPKGRVFDMFDTTVHILPEDHPYDPDLPVWIGIDPGYSGQPSHYAVEVVQKRVLPCNQPHFVGIDEIFVHSMTNEGVCDIATTREWWANDDKVGVIDIAGTYHAGASEPVKEVWRKKTGLVCHSQKVNILPGIKRMAAMFNLCPMANCGEPVFVLSPKMEGAIAEFSGLPHPTDKLSHPYRWQTDKTGSVMGHTPRDEYCDAIKALTYLFIDRLGHTITANSRKKIAVKKRQRVA